VNKKPRQVNQGEEQGRAEPVPRERPRADGQNARKKPDQNSRLAGRGEKKKKWGLKMLEEKENWGRCCPAKRVTTTLRGKGQQAADVRRKDS